ARRRDRRGARELRPRRSGRLRRHRGARARARARRLWLRGDPAHRTPAGSRDRSGARILERRRRDPPRRPRARRGTRRMSLEATVHDLATRARSAAERTAELGTRAKDAWLLRAAERLEAARERVREANARDLAAARERGVEAPLVARLELSDAKWADMIAGLRDVGALPDPIGRIEASSLRPNGLRVGRMRIPLGVIA